MFLALLHSDLSFCHSCTYLVVLRIAKFVLACLANYIVLSPDQPTDLSSLVGQALNKIPDPSADCMIRDVADSIAHRLKASDVRLKYSTPDRQCITSVILLAWTTATGRGSSLQSSVPTIRQLIQEGNPNARPELYSTCKEALEVLTVMFMLSPDVLDQFTSMEPDLFPGFVIDLVLICKERYVCLDFLSCTFVHVIFPLGVSEPVLWTSWL